MRNCWIIDWFAEVENACEKYTKQEYWEEIERIFTKEYDSWHMHESEESAVCEDCPEGIDFVS